MVSKEEDQELFLSDEYVKIATGEFDLHTVFHIELSGRSISRIDALDQCINLRWVDLSRNWVSVIENISGLANLQVLDLSFNRIEQIQNLSDLTALETLRLQGNRIARLEDLDGLTETKHLQHLSLKNVDGGDGCPVCSVEGYCHRVQEICPSLVALDGQRRDCPELTFDPKYGQKPAYVAPPTQPWIKPSDGHINGFDMEGINREIKPLLDEFDAALQLCEAALQDGQNLLEKHSF